MSYKLFSLIQSIIFIVLGIVLLDNSLLLSGDDFGIYEMLFDSPDTWWSLSVFQAYCFIAIGILQLVKAISSED